MRLKKENADTGRERALHTSKLHDAQRELKTEQKIVQVSTIYKQLHSNNTNALEYFTYIRKHGCVPSPPFFSDPFANILGRFWAIFNVGNVEETIINARC